MKTATSIITSVWLIGSAAALSAASAIAQGPSPTVQAPPPSITSSSDDAGPISVAPPDTPAQPSAAVAEGESGTTVVGDKEAPIGLYITPWKDGYAEHGLDRPARFVDVDTSPIDPDTFQRRINYYNVITDYREAHLASGK
ncbi:MAG: hypothetical protein JWR16_809 [Nevskia sp.]|nr:hypothetical protein [Nevskia sp.]